MPEPTKPATSSQSGGSAKSSDAPQPQTPGEDKPPELEGAAKIKKIVEELPKDTPESHVMFGYGNHKVTIGDLKKI